VREGVCGVLEFLQVPYREFVKEERKRFIEIMVRTESNLSVDIRRYFEEQDDNMWVDLTDLDQSSADEENDEYGDEEWEEDLKQLIASLKSLSHLVAMQLGDFISKRLLYSSISFLTGIRYIPPKSILPHVHCKEYYIAKRISETIDRPYQVSSKGFISLVSDS